MDNNKRRIASLALFRKLYNEGRSDVMTILCEFAKNVIYSKRLTAFTPTQIKNELKCEYDFSLPEYVVESVIKKFCHRENSMYYPDNNDAPQKVNDQVIERIENSHEVILSKLISFVEKKIAKTLTPNEKEKLFQSLCAFLIDETDVEYAEYISSFVVETQNDEDLTKLIKTIKEGVILYTGIQYNDCINEIGSWKDDFTIFVEQEILFHMAGYNGELYQQLFVDFFDLIKEINQKARKQLIKIKYFDSVRIEIEKFFNIAERIVDGKDTLDCSNIAMTSIVQGCDYKTDVIEKKCSFFDMLKKNLILEEDGGSYFKQNSKYNLFYDENLSTLSTDIPERNVEWSLRLLNYISMIRKGSMSGFERAKCILLTGNSTTMAVAFHRLIKQNGDVPLATTLDYITNKLWFKLNKGFGGKTYPKSFDIVTKAQIILSTQVVGSVAQEFDKIKKEIVEKTKTESVIIAELAELKTKVMKPEEVQPGNIDEVLDTITMADTERYLREKEMEQQEAIKQREENERLQNEIKKKEQEKEKLESEKNNWIKRQELENEELARQLSESRTKEKQRIKEQIEAISARKEKADKKVQNRVRRLRWIPFAIIILVFIVVVFGTYRYGWDKMEFWTWLLSVVIVSIPYLVFALGFKEWNPRNVIEVWYKDKYEKKLYSEYNVDLNRLKQLESEFNCL